MCGPEVEEVFSPHPPPPDTAPEPRRLSALRVSRSTVRPDDRAARLRGGGQLALVERPCS